MRRKGVGCDACEVQRKLQRWPGAVVEMGKKVPARRELVMVGASVPARRRELRSCRG